MHMELEQKLSVKEACVLLSAILQRERQKEMDALM